jgi:hypothetical protein
MHLWRSIAVLIMPVLIGCSGPQLPLSKNEPAPINDQLTQPPWETLVEAGPNAYKDVDLETLDGPATASLVDEEAKPSESAVGEEVADAKKSVAKSKNVAAVTAVAVMQVKGAKGQGNAELAAALKAELQKAGWPVVAKRQLDAISVTGLVKSTAGAEGERVEITWFVHAPDGKLLGDVKQVNDVPKGSLAEGFGPAAMLVAEGAAAGIFELVDKYR